MHVGIGVGVLGDDGVEDGQEGAVLSHGVGGGRDGGRGAEGEGGGGRRGGQEGEEVAVFLGRVRVHVNVRVVAFERGYIAAEDLEGSRLEDRCGRPCEHGGSRTVLLHRSRW